MGACASCFGASDESRRERAESDRAQSEDARRKAAEAAQGRQEEFEKSAYGRATRAQINAQAKQSRAANTGESVLKWQMG